MPNFPDGMSSEALENAFAGYEPDEFVVPDNMVVTRTSNPPPDAEIDFINTGKPIQINWEYFAMYKDFQCDGDLVGQGATPEWAVIDLLAQHDGLDDALKAKYLTKGDL